MQALYCRILHTLIDICCSCQMGLHLYRLEGVFLNNSQSLRESSVMFIIVEPILGNWIEAVVEKAEQSERRESFYSTEQEDQCTAPF